MISAAVIAAGMLASCSNKEIVDEQPETDGVSASVLNIVPTVGTDTRAGFVPKTEWAVNDAMGAVHVQGHRMGGRLSAL